MNADAAKECVIIRQDGIVLSVRRGYGQHIPTLSPGETISEAGDCEDELGIFRIVFDLVA